MTVNSLLTAEIQENPVISVDTLIPVKPFSAENGGFGKRWRKIALAAKCDGLQRRDLRRTCVTRLKEVGVSHEGIRDITGHSMKLLLGIMAVSR